MKNIFLLLLCSVTLTAQADWSADVRPRALNCEGIQTDFMQLPPVGPNPKTIKIEITGSLAADQSYQSAINISVNGAPAPLPATKVLAFVGAMVETHFQLWTSEGNFNFSSGDESLTKWMEQGNLEAPLKLDGFALIVFPNATGAEAYKVSCEMTLLKYCRGGIAPYFCDKMK